MAIKIRQYQSKWRLEIEQEEFEFDSREDMVLNLGKILDLKEKNGQIKNRRIEG